MALGSFGLWQKLIPVPRAESTCEMNHSLDSETNLEAESMRKKY